MGLRLIDFFLPYLGLIWYLVYYLQQKQFASAKDGIDLQAAD